MSVRGNAPEKRDGNEGVIIDALRDVGAHVTQLSGAGVPDLLVIRDRIYLLEVKNGKSAKLTDKQETWHGQATDYGGYTDVHIVRTVNEALQAIGASE